MNISGAGASISHRSRHGSIGTHGFSLRTGIPGLSYRQRWGKNVGGAAVIMLGAVMAIAIAAFTLRVLVHLLLLLWQALQWVVLTTYDLCVYVIQQFRQWYTRFAQRP